MKPAASLGVLALGIGLSGSAEAADIGIQAEPSSPAVANTWSGPYVGVNLGGAWQSAPGWTYFNPNNGARFSLTGPDNGGVVGGAQGGYNWQTGALLVGAEGDISRTSLGQTRTVPTIGVGSFARMSADDDWLASLRGRVGLTGWTNVLFYFTGGLASANIDDKAHMTRFIGPAEYVADAASATEGGLGRGRGRRMDGRPSCDRKAGVSLLRPRQHPEPDRADLPGDLHSG